MWSKSPHKSPAVSVSAALLRPDSLWHSLECSQTPLTADLLSQEAAPVYHCWKEHRLLFNPPTHRSIHLSFIHPSTYPSIVLGRLQGKSALSGQQNAPPTQLDYLMDEVTWVNTRRFSMKMMSAASSRAEMAVRVMKRNRPEMRWQRI